ncbi:MAG: hypothetical protein ACREJX_09400, partial [Polyangiaceae bacterium]
MRALPAAATSLVIVGACTVFNGLSVPDTSGGDASLDGTSDTGEASNPIDAGGGFLTLEDAVKFCVNAFNCPNLATSVLESIDVPVDVQHFSSCVDWMAGPLPPDRTGVATTAQFLKCAADATSCSAAGDCVWLDLVDTTDPRCTGVDSGPLDEAGFDPGTCSPDGGDVLFCKGSPSVFHCSNAYWGAGTKCGTASDQSHYCYLTGPCGVDTDCDGSVLSYCSTGGRRVSYDCAPGGFSCGT